MYQLFLKFVKNFTKYGLALCLLFASCSHPVKKVEEDSGIREIDVMTSLSNIQKVNLSEVASNIEYYVLETDKKCLLTPSMSIFISKEYIVAIGGGQSTAACYVFERKTGKFLRQISRLGQGPGEYIGLLPSFWDAKNEQVCVRGVNNQYIFYNLDGTISHYTSLIPGLFVEYKDLYVHYCPNMFGDQTMRIGFRDKTGVLIDSIPEYRSWKRTKTSWGTHEDRWLYVFNDGLYCKDLYCDTLYCIKDFALHPRYVFNTGGLAVPYKIQEGGQYERKMTLNGPSITDRYEQYMCILKIFEYNKYLYFTVEYRLKTYYAIYDKTENMLKIMQNIFENDLDGGLPFWPQRMVSDNEMMCVFPADKLLELDVSKITDEKLKNVLNSLEEDSNPVVAIVTLKD